MSSRLLLLACLCALLSPASRAQSNYWVQTNGPGSGYDVRSFAATSAGTLYAGTWTDGTIWKTTNLGGSWTLCGPIPNPNPVLSICALPNDHLLACVYLKGIFRSTDGGASWQERDSLLTDTSLRMSVVDDSGYVWVATVSGLFCSTNEGATWSLREAGGFYQVYLDSSHAILTTDATYLYRSTTHGRTWTKTILAPCGDLRGVHPDGSYFGVTASSAIYRSTDLGATWTDMHSGVTWSGYTDAMAFSAGGRIFYGRDGSEGGMLYSADTGKTWTILNSGLTTNRVIPLFRHRSGYIFVGTNGAGVFRSAASADTTYRVAINVSPLSCSFGLVRIGVRDTITVLVKNSGNADTLRVGPIASTNARFSADPAALLVPPGSTRTLRVVYTPAAAATDTGTLSLACNDPALAVVTLPLAGQGYGVTAAPSIISLSLLPNTYFTARIIWVRSATDSAGAPDQAMQYTVWRRIAGGQGAVWEFMTTVPAIGLGQYAVDQSLPAVYGGGTPWYTFMVAVQTRSLQTYYSAPDSIQDPPLTGISGVQASSVPADVMLRQNYPNPFNPATVIEYGLPRSARVTLIVYNMLGQEVIRLVDAVEEAGYHRATFDGAALASGVYYCRLVAGSFVRTQRMLLVR